MENFAFGIGGIFVGIVGIMVSIIFGIRYRKVRDMASSSAWNLFQDSSVILTLINECASDLHNGDHGQALRKADNSLGKSQSLVQATIRNIANMKTFTVEDLDRWIQAGSISDTNRPFFYPYAKE